MGSSLRQSSCSCPPLAPYCNASGLSGRACELQYLARWRTSCPACSWLVNMMLVRFYIELRVPEEDSKCSTELTTDNSMPLPADGLQGSHCEENKSPATQEHIHTVSPPASRLSMPAGYAGGERR